MSDIAQASGLTRPTLYLSFPDKEQIFAAVVEKMVAEKLAETPATADALSSCALWRVTSVSAHQ